MTLNHLLTVDWFYLDALEEGGLGRFAGAVKAASGLALLIRPHIRIFPSRGRGQLAAIYTLPRAPDILAAAAVAPTRGVTGTAYFALHETRERIQQAHYWSRHGVPPPGYRCIREPTLANRCWPYLTVVTA